MNEPIRPVGFGTIPWGSKRERTTENRKVGKNSNSTHPISLKMGEGKSTVV